MCVLFFLYSVKKQTLTILSLFQNHFKISFVITSCFSPHETTNQKRQKSVFSLSAIGQHPHLGPSPVRDKHEAYRIYGECASNWDLAS